MCVLVGRLARSTKDSATAADAGLGEGAPQGGSVPAPVTAVQPTHPPVRTHEPFAAPGNGAAPLGDPLAGPTV